MFKVYFDDGNIAIWSSDQIASYFDSDDGYNPKIVRISTMQD